MGWEWIIALDKFSLYMAISQVLDGIFYSAGQKFRTFNAMDFLWPPWERGANFEHGGV